MQQQPWQLPFGIVRPPLQLISLTVAFLTRTAVTQPSLASMAAATVAAACAWWASQGLIPFCPPIHPTFSSNPTPSIPIPVTETAHAPNDSIEKVADNQKPIREDQPVVDAELSVAPKTASQGSKSLPSSSDSEDAGGTGSPSVKPGSLEAKPVPNTQEQDKEKKPRKQVDRSSCGSNTPSSSDVETDILGKTGEAKEPTKETELNPASGETTNRRSRSSGSSSDSWKEVSEEVVCHCLHSKYSC